MAASLLGLALLCGGSTAAFAQSADNVLHFSKDPAARQLAANQPTPMNYQLSSQPRSYTLQPVAMQQPAAGVGAGRLTPEENQEYFVQLEPPGPQRLFRLESEQALNQRMREEALQLSTPARLEFPQYRPLSADQRPPTRSWPGQTMTVEPSYVCYKRLFFEDLNTERYGWDLGIVAPFASTLTFWKDVLLLPYHAGTEPCRCQECSSGYCLPGDPVPYLCYPPHWSLTGAIAEAGVVVGLAAIFP